MSKPSFLPPAELAKLTGETNPKKQVAVLHRYGLHPFINQMTGQPVIYREVVMAAMAKDRNATEAETYINWDAINEKKKQRPTSILPQTT